MRGTIVPNGTIAPSDKPIGTIVPFVTHHGGLIIPVIHPKVPWSLTAWRDFRDERAAIRQFDGGMTRTDADHWAWLDCIAKWLERHPPVPSAQDGWMAAKEHFRLCRIRDAKNCLYWIGVKQSQNARISCHKFI